MLWKTIDNLTNNTLSHRAGELRQQLKKYSDCDLVLFHHDAVDIFLQLFIPRIYYLYCAAFDGEANGSGLTDFCSNLVLSGRSLVDDVLLNPDNFARVPDIEPFNQDNGLDVSSIAWHILVGRYGEERVDDMFSRGGVQSLKGIWEELEKQVGNLTFEIDRQQTEASLPRIYARMHNQ